MKSVFLYLIIVDACWVSHSILIFETFKFWSFTRFRFNNFLQFAHLVNFIFQVRMVTIIDILFSVWTRLKIEVYTRPIVPSTDYFWYAIDVENMFAIKLHARLLCYLLKPSNRTICISILIKCKSGVFCNTVWMNSRQSLLLIDKSITWMLTLMDLISKFLCFFLTLITLTSCFKVKILGNTF